jgi:hypothetical protein
VKIFFLLQKILTKQMIAHNSDHKRIASIILDMHMSIVSEQWTNYSCPMFLDFQTSVCRYTQNYPFLVCIYMHWRWRSSYQEGGGWDPISLFNSATCCGLSEARIWFLTSSVVVFLLCSVNSVKMRSIYQEGERWGLFRFVWYRLIWRP